MRDQRFTFTVAFVVVVPLLIGSAQADTVKLQPMATTASSTAPGYFPENVNDGSRYTIWSSGVNAPAWIQFDLGRTVAIRTIRLQAHMSTTGPLSVNVIAGQDPDHFNLVSVVNFTSVSDGQWLEIDGGPGIPLGLLRYVRIETEQSPSIVGWKEIELHSGLDYFGYYQSDSVGDSQSNLAWFLYNPGSAGHDISDLVANLPAYRQYGAKVIVDVQRAVYPDNCGSLLPNYCSSIRQLAQAVHDHNGDNAVASYYIADECQMTNPAGRQTVAAVASCMRDPTFPLPAPLSGIFAAGDVLSSVVDANATIAIQQSFDWVGFDCYGDWSLCGDAYKVGSGYDTGQLVTSLRQILAPSQRMIAMPSAELFYGYGGKTFDEASIIASNINRWNAELLSNGDYAAVFPYTWTDGIGASALPLVQQRINQLQRSFMSPGDPYLYSVYQWASSSPSGVSPFAAFDGKDSTAWTSPTAAPYFVGEGFGGVPWGGSTHIDGVHLVAKMPTTSQVGFVLEGCAPITSDCSVTPDPSPSPWSTLATWSGPLSDGQYLSFSGNWDVAGIRVRTTQGPASSGWSEIYATQAKPPMRSTALTGAPGASGGDGFHLDRNGQLWHAASSTSGWSNVPAPTRLTGGIARITNSKASNYDAIVVAGIDGHLYQYYTQSGSAYTWNDMGVPQNCDGVVGNPAGSTGYPANGQLDISYRCYNNNVGIAESSGDGVWRWIYPASSSQSPAGTMSDPAHGSGSPVFDTHVYVVGYDGMLYRCIPNSGCAPEFGNNPPSASGYKFVGTPGVAYSQVGSTPTRWILIADNYGQLWQFDGYYGNWTNLGLPYCGAAEGDVSVAADSVNNVWLAAVRCRNEDEIEVYSMTPGSNWTQIDTFWYGSGNTLSKPLVTAQSSTQSGSFQGNVSFETSSGEQIVATYVGAAKSRYVTSYGWVTP
jgi:hypothetical protein